MFSVLGHAIPFSVACISLVLFFILKSLKSVSSLDYTYVGRHCFLAVFCICTSRVLSLLCCISKKAKRNILVV